MSERLAQLRLMVRSLLADRFQLTVCRETKDLPVYALVVAKNGAKLKASADGPGDSAEPNRAGPQGPPIMRRMATMGRGQLTMNGAPMSLLADSLSRQLGRVVLDQTGLKGTYDLELQWTPDESQGQTVKGAEKGAPEAASHEASGPSLFTALQEQLGLKLESTKGPVETYVIERAERPSPN